MSNKCNFLCPLASFGGYYIMYNNSMRRILLLIIICLYPYIRIYAQDILDVTAKKQIIASRIMGQIKVDAILDEMDWQAAVIATDFIQQEPDPGTTPSHKTEVRIVYDNKAIYIGAHLYDDPEAILTELTDRDDVGNTDWFYIGLDPYLNGTNGFGFLIASTGVQFDAILGAQGEDTNWDAVWDSAVRITEDGWVVEVKLPYSALRFPDLEKQTWGINFGRKIQRNQEKAWWSEVNPKEAGFINQFGTLLGIEGIKAPIRLSATPFVATTSKILYDVDKDRTSNQTQINGGLDIKYGINDAFTLDMTLIPDFGQVRSDEQVLNLSPFEVFFDENRPFFTEGVELFSKGNLFYSRRVGGSPYNKFAAFAQLKEDEVVKSNPQNARLVNATKISGRTNRGLGLGFFNAIERKEFAQIIDTMTGASRTVQTNPLTNYNVIVLDQNLPNNSSISLINTHVYRAGSAVDAIVTGTQFDLRNKKNTYSINGSYARSQRILEAEDQIGHSADINIGKISGAYRWFAWYVEESANFNPNDLGFLRSPNERSAGAGISYLLFNPKGIFNQYRLSLNWRYERLFEPDVFVGMRSSIRFNYQLKNFWRGGLWFNWRPFGDRDYFEPRLADFSQFYHEPQSINLGGWLNTDSRKRLQMNVWFDYNKYFIRAFHQLGMGVFPSLRVSDRISFELGVEWNNRSNHYGWVASSEDEVFFGQRDRTSVISSFGGKYNFSSLMNLNINVQHNWTQVVYKDYFTLNAEGWFDETTFESEFDQTFNFFNIDLVYRWRILPGSDIFFTYKNIILNFDRNSEHNYFGNLQNLFSFSQANSFSLKFIYFLDYLYLQKQGSGI